MHRPAVAIVLAAVVAAAFGYGAARALETAPSGPVHHPPPYNARSAIPLAWQAHEVGPAAFGAPACAGGLHCVAFGPSGIVAKSDDGGRSWAFSRVARLAGQRVTAATCPSAARCVAIAVAVRPASTQQAPGIPLVSKDGGRTWARADVSGPALSFLGGLACPSATRCYATAQTPGAGYWADYLLESNDGGVSWTLRRQGPAQGLFGALACPGDGHCLATGGTGGLVATTDGGRSWTDETMPMGGGGRPGITVLSCPSVTTCAGAGMEPSPGYPVLVTTIDGGRSWRFALATGATGNDVVGGSYDAISCQGLHCVAVGTTMPAVGLVSVSDDGGRTWRAVMLGAGGSLSGVTCASDAGCVLTGTVGNGRALLALAATAGLGWRSTYVGPPTEWSALSCPSPRHCVAAEGSGPYAGVHVVATSTGERWTEARPPAGIEGIVALDCPSTRRCVAIADVPASQKVAQQSETTTVGALLSSDDGGRSWRRDLLEAPLESLDALSCPSASTCFAAGATLFRPNLMPDDALVETTDGGARWSAAVLPVFPPQAPTGTSGSEILGGGLTSISCFSSTSCVAAGPAGVLATGDGRQWSLRYETPGPGNGGVVEEGTLFGEIQLLTCPTPTRCVGVFSGPNGESLRLSSNGGRSFTSPESQSRSSRGSSWSPTFDALALSCPSASRCIAAGSDAAGAVVYGSDDGGEQWQKAPLPALTGAGSLEGVPSASYDAIGCAGPDWCLVLGAGEVGETAVAG